MTPTSMSDIQLRGVATIPRPSIIASGQRLRRSEPGGHIKSLDGLRGIAILMVLLFHFMPPRPTASLAGNLINNLWTFGCSGVDLFFVLSGFLITGILLDARGSAHYFRNFYARRALRIFPLYYGILFVGTLVVPRLGLFRSELPTGHTWWWWLYLSNVRHSLFHEVPRGWFGIYWSLAVEEHFYLLWPAVICFCSRRQAIGVSIACIFLATICRIYCVFADNSVAAYVLTLCRMDALAAGALVALTLRGGNDLGVLATRLKLIGLISGGAALLFGLRQYRTSPLPYLQLLALPLATCAYACLIAIVSRPAGENRVRRALESPMLRTIGKYSYGMYVLQFIVRSLLEKLLRLPAHPLPDRFLRANDAVNCLILIAATFGAAYVSWHLFEKHFLRLKRFFAFTRTDTPGSGGINPALHGDRRVLMAV